jgi:hypothetical protein
MPLRASRQIHNRLQKVESRLSERQVWFGPWPSLQEAIARRLSPADLEHVEEAKARRCDPDCPQLLEEVFERWGVAFVEAQIEMQVALRFRGRRVLSVSNLKSRGRD